MNNNNNNNNKQKTKRIYTAYNGKVLLSPYDVMDGVFKFLIRKPNS